MTPNATQYDPELVERMREALEPFVEYLDSFRDDLPDHLDLACFDQVDGLTIGDFRRARAALAAAQEAGQ